MKAVVLGGLGRSGTTLILHWFQACAENVCIGQDEAKFFSEPYGLLDLYRALVNDYTYARGLVAINEFRVLMQVHLPDAKFTGRTSILEGLNDTESSQYFSLLSEFIESLRTEGVPLSLSHSEFCERAGKYVSGLLGLFGKNRERVCFVEKTPHNSLVPWIFEALFNDVKFVWLIRDPRAVVYSTMKQDWGPNTLSGAILYVKQVTKRYILARKTVSHLEVRLEDLVGNTGFEIDRIERYTGATLNAESEPVRADILEDWKFRISADDIRIAENALREEIAALGYAAHLEV